MSNENIPETPPVRAVGMVVKLYKELGQVKDPAEKERIQKEIKAKQQAGHIKI